MKAREIRNIRWAVRNIPLGMLYEICLVIGALLRLFFFLSRVEEAVFFLSLSDCAV